MSRPTHGGRVARALAAATFLVGSTLGAQGPVHSYTLDGTLADLFGGPSLVPTGTVESLGAFGATGYRFDPVGEGFSLTGALTNPGVYSIELRFSFDAVDDWRRILEFHGRQFDEGLYDFDGAAVFYDEAYGTSPDAFIPGQLTHVVATRDAAGLFSAYVNGALELSFLDVDGLAVFDGPGGIMNFFLDNVAPPGGGGDDGCSDCPPDGRGGFGPAAIVGGFDEEGTGFVDYINVYDRALTPTQVAALVAVPEPATLALVATGMVAAWALARRRRG